MKRYWIAAIAASLVACATSPIKKAEGSIRITAGSREAFREAACYAAPDIVDSDDLSVTVAQFERELARRHVHLHRCGPNERAILAIAYQAGRGVCIDCDLPATRWSGFAFITLMIGEREVASAEWQGAGADDGRMLLRRFAIDLEELLSASLDGSPRM